MDSEQMPSAQEEWAKCIDSVPNVGQFIKFKHITK